MKLIFLLLSLIVGVVLYWRGNRKGKVFLRGMGVGVLLAIVFMEAPNFIHGFVEGFQGGFNN
ncbi:hypothetical protein H0266_11855 [Halobacillus locisalis]|uniref:Uncharacterized protein n=1 Tax=Halobacillus locisalis TaxID=220753 RepID=A0A838CVE1_9BACI|nr:hypothetical protein [Halobacillus locisalis]MBA2175586.1 hypothetical protein [Halobacillus locisalis]